MLIWAHIRFFIIYVKVCFVEHGLRELLNRCFGWTCGIFDRLMDKAEKTADAHKRVEYLLQAGKIAESVTAIARLHSDVTQKIGKDSDEALRIAEWLGYDV